MKRVVQISLFIALLVAVSVLWPVHSWIMEVIAWVREAGAWGVLVFAVLYVAATLMLLPVSVFSLGAGFVYGPLWGTLLVSPVSVTGAFIAFSLARGRLRPWIENKMRDNRRFMVIDRIVGDKGFRIVTLLRLSPLLPFAFLNYALGLTGVRAGSYVLASFLGMLPATFLYTYIGSLVANVSELASGPQQGATSAQHIFLLAGFTATIVVTAYITALARRALRQATPEAEASSDPQNDAAQASRQNI